MDDRTHILYLSHIHWDWIKQRPQFLAEELSRHFKVSYFYGKVYKDGCLKENKAEGVELRELPRIPARGNKSRPLVAFNDMMARKIVEDEVARSPFPLIWLTEPRLLSWIPKDYYGPIVYDCMDDHVAFHGGRRAAEIVTAEHLIVERASLVLVSSERLAEKITSICNGDSSKVLLVRNGFNGVILEDCGLTCRRDGHRDSYKACYFGTISSWFDFECIGASLERHANLSYKIIGPIETGTEILRHPRVEYTGPVAHDALADYVSDCDCFVMPFRLDDIVLSVDPVKMYEYINFGKDIVCVRYPEVERFDAFAELYNGSQEYCDAMRDNMVRSLRKYDGEQRLNLLDESNWHCRVKPVFEALAAL